MLLQHHKVSGGEAVHYAAYTQNKVPCSSNPTTTPAVEFLGEKPDPDKLVLLSKKGFRLIMPEDRKAASKLYERAREGRVVGYGLFPGAYRWRMADTGKDTS
jgi:hypothetical protein